MLFVIIATYQGMERSWVVRAVGGTTVSRIILSPERLLCRPRRSTQVAVRNVRVLVGCLPGLSQALAALECLDLLISGLLHVDIVQARTRMPTSCTALARLSDQECADMHDALSRLDADVSSGAFVSAP